MLNIGNFKDVAGIFGKGLLLEMAPKIAGGFINDLFHEWKVDVLKIANHVMTDRYLWEKVTDEQWSQLKTASDRVGGLDFLTVDLVIDGIKKDFPAVASLFLNWPRAADWLGRQLDLLRQELSTR